jgi:hypothetical protein
LERREAVSIAQRALNDLPTPEKVEAGLKAKLASLHQKISQLNREVTRRCTNNGAFGHRR